uniref:Odorant receptor n=1 Tax=Lutzomyia longipalpis TaxID=7200 RepID=A0A7G3AK58_LUTLO
MPSPSELELFLKFKSQIEFGISLMTLNITNGPPLNCFVIFSMLLSNLSVVTFSLANIMLNFEGKLTTNSVFSCVTCIGALQIVLKALSVCSYENHFLQILMWAQSLYNERTNSEEINEMIRKILLQFHRIWIYIFKFVAINTILVRKLYLKIFLFRFRLFFWLYILSGLALCVINALMGDEGVIFRCPFISLDYQYYLEVMHLLQLILIMFAILSTVYADSSLIFLGLHIMAALDILNEYITLHKNRMEVNKNFIENVLKRYCDLVDNIDLFNEAISILSFVQFITSTILFLFVFCAVTVDSNNPIGHVIVVCSMIQLFLPCLFGEVVKIKTDRLSETLYMINWYNLSVTDQKSFLILLGVMQKTYGLKAAGMYNITLYTFIQVINSSIRRIKSTKLKNFLSIFR